MDLFTWLGGHILGFGQYRWVYGPVQPSKSLFNLSTQKILRHSNSVQNNIFRKKTPWFKTWIWFKKAMLNRWVKEINKFWNLYTYVLAILKFLLDQPRTWFYRYQNEALAKPGFRTQRQKFPAFCRTVLTTGLNTDLVHEKIGPWELSKLLKFKDY